MNAKEHLTAIQEQLDGLQEAFDRKRGQESKEELQAVLERVNDRTIAVSVATAAAVMFLLKERIDREPVKESTLPKDHGNPGA